MAVFKPSRWHEYPLTINQRLRLPPETRKATCQICMKKKPVAQLLRARNGKLTCRQCNKEYSA